MLTSYRILAQTLLLFLALVGGCTATPQTARLLHSPPAQLAPETRLARIPFFPQDQYQCGPAALATVLVASQVQVTPAQLVPQVYVPGRQGSFQLEIMAAARNHGRLAYQLEPSIEALLAEIDAGNPVLVLQNLGLSWYPQWHFAVVKGYSLAQQQIMLNSGIRENYNLPLRTFERTWERAEHWALVVLPPAKLPATAQPQAFFEAAVALERSNLPAVSRKAYQAGLQRWPWDKQLLMASGNLLYTLGEFTEAVSSFRQAIAFYPDYAPAYNNLAHVLSALGQDHEAIRLAEQAVSLGGEYARDYRDTLSELRGNAGSARTP